MTAATPGTFLLPSLALILAFFVASCQSTSSGQAANTAKGEEYYTQFSLFQERNRHLTTNYRRGILVPINTKVTFMNKSGKAINVKEASGTVLNLVNVPDYSGEDINGIFNRTFSKQPVDLSGFTESEQRNIKNGTVALGMSKDAVVRALGYPPKHETPSLESNHWRYWAHRFKTYMVSFQDGKVSKVEPPHQMEGQ